ncbi:MAG: calcineurin-like phosphoesterase family protein [Armatimonadetes bacterium]|nr:calcineurin-like phosphoesterase family protein [Armatimonadota bacterium]
MRQTRLTRIVPGVFFLLLAGPLSAAEPSPARDRPVARGTVFEDRDRDGVRDPGERGLSGVRVSNGREVVKTDRRGVWRLPHDDDTIFFVIKPRGWMTPVNEHRLPRFYYIHKPAGSPKQKYPGVEPTGPLPASIDFPLHRQKEPDRFRAVFFADPQPRNQQEIDYIAHDVVEELVGVDASFGVTLGDIMFDNLSLFGSLNSTVALIGIPWYNVIGNHDINYDSPDDKHSDETFERHYGPSYYSFDHGPVHFIVLDDIEWTGRTAAKPGAYAAGLGAEQVEFVKNDLAHVPKNQLIVLMMHIPLNQIRDRHGLYRLIENRPFTMSISGHTHYQEHRFITREGGWQGPEPHHHVVNVTVSGSWWQGAPDERGIPHALMSDGAPNGYSILTFDGTRYSIEFKAAARPAEYQMNLYAPDFVSIEETGKTEVVANVFAGSDRSRVEMRVGDGNWTPMERVRRVDPQYQRLKELEAGPNPPPGRRLPAARATPHIWRAMLPNNLKPGTYAIEVRETDMFGKTNTAQRRIYVTGPAP